MPAQQVVPRELYAVQLQRALLTLVICAHCEHHLLRRYRLDALSLRVLGS